MAKKYYAVRKGKKPGIYTTWDQCKAQTSGFSGAEFKSFESIELAQAFILGGSSDLATISSTPTSQNSESPQTSEPILADNQNEIIAYVDGSYDHSTRRYSAGVVLINSSNEIHISEAYSDKEMADMRNVAGEIMGSTLAIQYALDNNYSKITIHHDYEGVAKWCTGDWKANKTGTQEYRRFYTEASKKIKIAFVKVKAHSGDKYNDIADCLAKHALGIGG